MGYEEESQGIEFEVWGTNLPHQLDCEEQVLGLMMEDPSLVPVVKQYVESDDFYMPANIVISNAIYSLANEGAEPRVVAVVTKLQAQQAADYIQQKAITQFDSSTPSEGGSMSAHAIWCAKEIREASERRQYMMLMRQKYELFKDPLSGDLDELLTDLVDKSFGIRRQKDTVSVKSELGDIMKLLSSGDVFGISTGMPSLDAVSCGYQPGELYILGGRPAMGKTALALKLIALLCKAGKSVVFISLEMALRQLLLRTLSFVSQVPYRCFRQKDAIPAVAWPRIVVAASQVAEWPLYVEDSPGSHIEQIIARAESRCRQQHVDVVFLDHLHLIPTDGNGNNNAEAYSHITLLLKNLARRLNLPVVCLAQLNRGVESRPDKRPKLSDLRESGGIEQNADNVWLLYRENYYEKGEHHYNGIEQVELIVAKNKSLETGTIELNFAGAFMEFRDPDTGKSEEPGLMG